MKFLQNHKNLGMILFYLLWPLVWFYAPLRVRVRVIILVHGEILVVRNWFGSRNHQLPGGGMKFGESIMDTAKREIMEEVGVTLDTSKLKLLSENVQVVQRKGLLLRYKYLLASLPEKPPIEPSSEITDYKWIPISELEVPQTIKSAV